MAALEQFDDLFEKRTFAHLATNVPDGVPRCPRWGWATTSRRGACSSTPSAGGARSGTSSGTRRGVGLVNPDDPYRFGSDRGEVVEVTEESADAHIDALAERYMDVEEYPSRENEENARGIVHISTDWVAAS